MVLSGCTGAPGRQPLPTPGCGVSQTLCSPRSTQSDAPALQDTTPFKSETRGWQQGPDTRTIAQSAGRVRRPRRSPRAGAAAHPLPCEAARPRSGRVWEELIQPGLPLLQHAVARGDGEQVHSQLVQGVAEQLPVVIDRVEGAAGQGEMLRQPAPVSWQCTGQSLPLQGRKRLGWASCHAG